MKAPTFLPLMFTFENSKKDNLLKLQLVALKVVLFLLMLNPWLRAGAQGLQFNSNDSLMSKRTSYIVFANNPPTFKDHLSISFDLSLWDNDHLGYVFNITDTQNNSYSLTYIYNHNGSPTLNFNIDSKSNKIEIPLNLAQLKKRTWIKIKAEIDLKGDALGFLVNGKWYHARGFGFTNQITPRITFGRNPHYSDVPKMAVKNLVVADDDKTYTFPLNEWKGKLVYNTDGDALGLVEHPVWLINESYFWAPKYQLSFNEVVGLNFDANRQNLFVYKSDSLLMYNTLNNNLTVKPYKNKLPMPLLLGKSIVNTRQNMCYVYEVQPPDTLKSIAGLDLNTLTWQTIGKGFIKEQRHHHNIFYDKYEADIYLFGGYGSFSYHKDFFKYNQAADEWQKVIFTGDTITPRFFSGSTQADENNDVYIFGGYGNQSGNQIIGGTHFYDLYRVNLTKHTIKKCWEITPREEAFVSANNLILSSDKKYFYALCYPHERPKTNLRLYKFSVKDGSYEIVSGTIPVVSERIESDFNLFYNSKQNMFWCTAQEFTSPHNSVIKLYSLVAPPVSQAQYLNSQLPPANNFKTWYLFPLLAIVAFGSLVWYQLRRRKRAAVAIDINEDITTENTVKNQPVEKKPNAVYLMGEFTAFNKTSRDITYLFSPKIKQLFILILLNSREGNGVVSKKISTILWPEKEVAKTKNIKGVTINHLRNIIADMEGIELTFLNDTYLFKLSEDFFCDYFLLTDAINKINAQVITPGQFIAENCSLIARGGLLQYVPETWLDDVKLTFEERLIEVILPELLKIYETGDYKKALEISRIILNMDPFNDTALKYKLKSVRRIKGIDHAKKLYDEFVSEYQKSLGSEYHIHFEKICK